MSDEKSRLEELYWERERRRKQSELDSRLKTLLPVTSYSFVSFSESDRILLSSDDWPKDKWESELYLQTELSRPESVEEILKNFLELVEGKYLDIFFMNYNFGIVQILKDNLLKYWKEFIDIDGDQIFCYLSTRPDFICIEKTEDIIVKQTDRTMVWLYEVTISNGKLKEQLKINGI